jgi:glycosyltransferase involved in cell wall biosynthesis
MADRMVTLASNRDLAREYRAKGIERAKEFTWDKCAGRTLALLSGLAGG